MKLDFLPELPIPAWVAISIATVRVLLDWKSGATFLANVHRVVVLYIVSAGVSYLSFMAMAQTGVAITNRDTVICSIIAFFGINIVYSLKTIGEGFERDPLSMAATLVRIWRAAQLPPSPEPDQPTLSPDEDGEDVKPRKPPNRSRSKP